MSPSQSSMYDEMEIQGNEAFFGNQELAKDPL
jgi:hypothetical protein